MMSIEPVADIAFGDDEEGDSEEDDRSSSSEEEACVREVDGEKPCRKPIAKSVSLADVEEELKKLQRSARRSVKVTVVNETNICIKLNRETISYGKWTLNPPQLILPYSTVVFGTDSRRKFLGGHKACVTYIGEDELHRECRFWFKWHNQVLNYRVHTDCSEYYSIGVKVTKKGRRSYVTFRLRKRSFESYTLGERMQYLDTYTYFNQKELKLLYNNFKEYCNKGEAMTRKQFANTFPELDNEVVLKNLFAVFSRYSSADDLIHFEEFASLLSIMARGSIEDKIELSFNICDLNRNGYISRDEFMAIISTISSVMQHLGYDPESFGNPVDIVEGLFRPRGADHWDASLKDDESASDIVILEKGISKQLFMVQAQEVSELAECFGLFKYFHTKVVDKVEKALGPDTRKPEYEGYLIKNSTRAIFGVFLHPPKLRYFRVREGFLAYYHGKEDKHPKKVIDLTRATVKEGKKGKFVLTTTNWTRTMRAKSNSQKEQWVKTLRANIRGGNRFQSFAPVRKKVNAKYLINGKEYFGALLEMLERAKHRVFIAGWYLSPGLFLKRNPVDESSRLDKVLYRTAERGVQIYVILWSASQFAFNLQSTFVNTYLRALHPNIHSITHPQFTPIYWSHHQKFVVIDDRIAFVGGIDIGYNRYDDEFYSVTDPDGLVYPGRDYSNFAVSGESNGKPFDSVVDRNVYPRMPWHDIVFQIDGFAAMDVAVNFVQRWNHIIATSSPDSAGLLYLFPHPIKERTPSPLKPQELGYRNNHCQVLRSVCEWSCGTELEKSITRGYISAIKNAKHFIYIENQYFISAIDVQPIPKNTILRALYERLRIAIRHNENFKVIVVLPVHPGADPKDVTTRIVMKHTYETIYLGEGSLLSKLEQDFPGVKLTDYISFYSLRNYGVLANRPVSEQVYVHAKLLIVDDRTIIVGSANINDRSMQGSRDSEICLFIENQDFIDSTMGGKPFKVSKLAHDLRMRLWRSFLGLGPKDESIKDPASDYVYKNIWRRTARMNTWIYKKVFQVLPETARTLDDLKVSAQPQNIDLLREIKGYLVEFPYQFLVDEQMTPTIFDKSYVLPRAIFV